MKALAAKRGKALRSHRELHGFVSEIRRELKDPEISTLWLSANSLLLCIRTSMRIGYRRKLLKMVWKMLGNSLRG